MVYLHLLEEGGGGLDVEESEQAGEAVVYLYGVLPVAICIGADASWGEKRDRGGAHDGWACCVRVFVREGCELHVDVGM